VARWPNLSLRRREEHSVSDWSRQRTLDVVSHWLTIPGVKVVWDEAKNRSNQKKHGVTFEEASRLFTSAADYLEIFDEAHSEEEDRFIAIGPVTRGVVLVVWTERDEAEVRIISARWATGRERELFFKYFRREK